MLTGLMGNALGYDRAEHWLLEALQERISYAARIDREPHANAHITDYVSSRLNSGDLGWTTRGEPEGRAGNSSARGSHQTWHDYLPDARLTVAVRLSAPSNPPTLATVAAALDRPKRPLYIGKKNCLPTARIFAGFTQARDCVDALLLAPLDMDGAPARLRLCWPEGESETPDEAQSTHLIRVPGGARVWKTRMHGGETAIVETTLDSALFPPEESETP